MQKNCLDFFVVVCLFYKLLSKSYNFVFGYQRLIRIHWISIDSVLNKVFTLGGSIYLSIGICFVLFFFLVYNCSAVIYKYVVKSGACFSCCSSISVRLVWFLCCDKNYTTTLTKLNKKKMCENRIDLIGWYFEMPSWYLTKEETKHLCTK